MRTDASVGGRSFSYGWAGYPGAGIRLRRRTEAMQVDIWTYRQSGRLGTLTDVSGAVGYEVEALDGSIGKVDKATCDSAAVHRRRHRPVDLRQEGPAAGRRHPDVDRRGREGLRQPDEGPDQERARVRRLDDRRRGLSRQLSSYYGQGGPAIATGTTRSRSGERSASVEILHGGRRCPRQAAARPSGASTIPSPSISVKNARAKGELEVVSRT